MLWRDIRVYKTYFQAIVDIYVYKKIETDQFYR